jgi:hypothetical protein
MLEVCIPFQSREFNIFTSLQIYISTGVTVIWPPECHLLFVDQGYEMLQRTSACRKLVADPQEHVQLEGQMYTEKRCPRSRFDRSFHVFMEQIAEN